MPPKNRKNKAPKRKKNKLCVLKTFGECLKKKIEILNSHGAIIKKRFLLWSWALITQSFYSKYQQLSETATMFRYRYFKQQKCAVCPLWIGFTCRFLGQSYSVVQVSSGKRGSENRKLGMVKNKKDKTCNSEFGWKKIFFSVCLIQQIYKTTLFNPKIECQAPWKEIGKNWNLTPC